MEAGRLKREIRKQLNITPKTSFAGVGVLDVVVDGKTIFSHQAERRMPGRAYIPHIASAFGLDFVSLTIVQCRWLPARS